MTAHTTRTYETWWAHAVTRGEDRPADPPLPPDHHWCGEWFPFGATEAGCHWRRPACRPKPPKEDGRPSRRKRDAPEPPRPGRFDALTR